MTVLFVNLFAVAIVTTYFATVTCAVAGADNSKTEDCDDTALFEQSMATHPKQSKLGTGSERKSDEKLEWWQTSVFYQIYPMSFKDANGDGKGDLQGIASKADHFVDIGVGAVWLSPIYSSPMADFGYDISNYTEINEIFGNLDDLVHLREKLHARGVKLILDFVPNHSSNEHPWFLKSVKKIDPYTNYYVWRDPVIDANGKKSPPNNWLSIFNSGSAWEWNEERGQYYLHQFAVQQPDLNYNSKELVEEMKEVLRFWLSHGVDGFRMDAVPYLFEDSLFRNEPYVDENIKNSKMYDSLIHIYSMDRPKTYEMIGQFRKVLDDFAKEHNTPPKVILSEAYTSLNYTMKYYGDAKNPGSHMPFNFLMINECHKDSSANDFNAAIHNWMDNMPDDHWANWVMGNHDQPRIATRYGPELVDAINMLVMLLPGTAITYNGEEIGMSNGYIRWDQTIDPAGINVGPKEYEKYSRDGCRTPFQWDDSVSAGFSSNSRTWLPVNPNSYYLNLKNQKEESYSHYHIYKRLTALRKTRTFQRGAWKTYVLSNWVLAIERMMDGEDSYVLVINLGSEYESIKLSDQIKSLPDMMRVHTASVNSAIKNGESVTTASSGFLMRPKSALVLTTSKEDPPNPAPASSSVSLKTSLFVLVFGILFAILR